MLIDWFENDQFCQVEHKTSTHKLTTWCRLFRAWIQFWSDALAMLQWSLWL